MAKNTYRKPVTDDYGWLTKLPLPTKEQALSLGKELKSNMNRFKWYRQ